MLALLAPTVLATTLLSGILGMGGGVTLVAVMAALLQPALVVPVHGVIQLVGNTTRTVALLRHVAWGLVGLYVPTLLVGALVGLRLYAGAGMPWFRPLVGGFVLAFLIWDRLKPRRLVLPRWVFLPAGLIGGIITMLVGASGPYLAAFFLRDDLDRHQIVATKAAIQAIGHLVKIPAFTAVGFAYPDHLGLILPLVACAVAGTLIGTRILRRLGEGVFQVAFRLFLAGLALRLILDAWL
jgi:uncharacterized membrane protein YfcA